MALRVLTNYRKPYGQGPHVRYFLISFFVALGIATLLMTAFLVMMKFFSRLD